MNDAWIWEKNKKWKKDYRMAGWIFHYYDNHILFFQESRSCWEGVRWYLVSFFKKSPTYLIYYHHHLYSFINRFASNMGYYGLSFSTNDLGGDRYSNCFWAGAVEIPGTILCYILLRKIGGRIAYVFMTCVATVMFLIVPFLEPGQYIQNDPFNLHRSLRLKSGLWYMIRKQN